MSQWKDISKLSGSDAKAREAAFEAEMLAVLAADKAKPPATLPTTTSSREGIRISVTANGQTTSYNMESVPPSIRDQIGAAWNLSPQPTVPPIITTAPATPIAHSGRSRSLRFAMTLNLLLPGAGQFYLGQRISGLLYASGFSACFITMVVLFVRAYAHYLQLATTSDILETGTLETLSRSFPAGTLLALSVAGTLIYVVSAIHLALGRDHKHPLPPHPRGAD
ncbi:MAG TPA: hypothetical protein VMP11_11880 [Verrucomicrobiae bacterium]|nr:hypothetical protein [Verrucomicrobiae bacterium]